MHPNWVTMLCFVCVHCDVAMSELDDVVTPGASPSSRNLSMGVASYTPGSLLRVRAYTCLVRGVGIKL